MTGWLALLFLVWGTSSPGAGGILRNLEIRLEYLECYQPEGSSDDVLVPILVGSKEVKARPLLPTCWFPYISRCQSGPWSSRRRNLPKERAKESQYGGSGLALVTQAVIQALGGSYISHQED